MTFQDYLKTPLQIPINILEKYSQEKLKSIEKKGVQIYIIMSNGKKLKYEKSMNQIPKNENFECLFNVLSDITLNKNDYRFMYFYSYKEEILNKYKDISIIPDLTLASIKHVKDSFIFKVDSIKKNEDDIVKILSQLDVHKVNFDSNMTSSEQHFNYLSKSDIPILPAIINLKLSSDLKAFDIY